jgi:hypothetical protein
MSIHTALDAAELLGRDLIRVRHSLSLLVGADDPLSTRSSVGSGIPFQLSNDEHVENAPPCKKVSSGMQRWGMAKKSTGKGL